MSHQSPIKEVLNAGLPEEMRVVKAVLKADYAAVAFSSADKQSRCYDAQWLDKSEDVAAVGSLPTFGCALPLSAFPLPEQA